MQVIMTDGPGDIIGRQAGPLMVSRAKICNVFISNIHFDASLFEVKNSRPQVFVFLWNGKFENFLNFSCIFLSKLCPCKSLQCRVCSKTAHKDMDFCNNMSVINIQMNLFVLSRGSAVL